MSSERLLCDLVGVDVARRTAGWDRLDAGRTDVAPVAALARRHRVDVWLHHTLADAGRSAGGLMESTRSAWIQNRAENVQRLAAAEEGLAALSQAGIRAVVLKGAYLIDRLYGGDPGPRAMTDVDLLVAPRAQAEAVTLLGRAGFSLRGGAAALEYPTVQLERAGVVLEVHRGLARPGRLSMPVDRILAEVRPLRFGQVDAWCLADVDQLLHLVVHLAQHAYIVRLAWLLDVALLVSDESWRWFGVVERARDWGASFALGMGLELARDLLHALVPEAVLGQAAGGVLRRGWYHLMVDGPGLRFSRLPPGRISDLLLSLPSVDSPAAALRMVVSYGQRKLGLAADEGALRGA